MSIGARIKQRREELGITQTQLAKAIGVTKGAVGNYETDVNSPKARTMYKVFKALQCDANYLYQDDMPASSAMLDDEERMVKLYRLLNREGQEKLIDYADDLVSSGKYIKNHAVKMVNEKA